MLAAGVWVLLRMCTTASRFVRFPLCSFGGMRKTLMLAQEHQHPSPFILNLWRLEPLVASSWCLTTFRYTAVMCGHPPLTTQAFTRAALVCCVAYPSGDSSGVAAAWRLQRRRQWRPV